MLVFASSDKGGTGRSVTSCNIAYHLAQREDVAYLDFDFGSPTSGAIFGITRAERGVGTNGLHTYFRDGITDPFELDVWQAAGRKDLRGANVRVGRLSFFPGELGGAEFGMSEMVVQRCAELLARLDNEFAVCIIDLSAGRSTALSMVLKATALPIMRAVTTRWLVFHRWTQQHIMAAHGLVHGERGIIDIGVQMGHNHSVLQEDIRFVRVAVPDLKAHYPDQSPAQAAWLHRCDEELRSLAINRKLGQSRVLGQTPVEPILQYREQLISAADVSTKIANSATVAAFRELSERLVNDDVWEG